MFQKNFKCFKCGKKFPLSKTVYECSNCGYSLDIEYDYSKIKKFLRKEKLKGEINHLKYYPFYPVKDFKKIVSMQEGGTPLIQSKEKENYFFKYEGVNPTGAFKDRGSSIELTKAIELNHKKVIVASTGNMGASIAAYAARAGIKAEVIIPSFTPKNKIKQMKFYGAKITKIKGSYSKAMQLAKEKSLKEKAFLTGDYPFRVEGQKSVAFEILEQLKFNAPENIVCPIGNGSLIYATFKACSELMKTGFIKRIPRIHGVQAQGCSPVVKAWEKGLKEVVPEKNAKTIATAILCDDPIDGLEALHAINESNGSAVSVSDEEIIKAKKNLALQGIYAELSGAAAFAGAKKLKLKGKTAIIVSGHGLKD